MLVNLCPHPIVVRAPDGPDFVLPVAGLARVSTWSSYAGWDLVHDGSCGGVDSHVGVYDTHYEEVTGLPDPAPGVTYIVSLVVLQACPDRRDLVAPGTGPQDGAIRDAEGKVIAVTRFVRLARPSVGAVEATTARGRPRGAEGNCG